MNYIDPFKAPFASPNWLKNFGLQTVCMFIPIIGPIVLGGYGADVVAARARDRHAQVPDFDFNFFTRYLQRGVWPFLVGLALTVLIVPCAVLSVVPVFIGASSNQVEYFLLGFATYMVGLQLSMLLLSFISTPFVLRASLLQNFAQSFDVRWALSWYRHTFIQAVAIILLQILLALPFTCIILATFTLAVYVIGPYMTNVGWHFVIAEYYIFLDKGGQPLTVVGYDGHGQPRGFDVVPTNQPPTPPAPPT